MKTSSIRLSLKASITTNTLTLHVPNFVDCRGSVPEPSCFSTTQELLSLPQVKAYLHLKGFSHFALDENRLMAIYYRGLSWWVIGTVRTKDGIDLPEWDGGKYKVRYSNGRIKILGSEDVVSVVGNDITLVTGQVVTDARNLN